MTPTVTLGDLKAAYLALRSAYNAATPGEWEITGEMFDLIVISTKAEMPKARHVYGDQTIIGSSEWTYLSDEDAKFIVLARNLLPTLFKAVEMLERLDLKLNQREV